MDNTLRSIAEAIVKSDLSAAQQIDVIEMALRSAEQNANMFWTEIIQAIIKDTRYHHLPVPQLLRIILESEAEGYQALNAPSVAE